MPPHREKKTLVLAFDGTGNKFQGNAGDSNVIKIFSCLDREDPNQHHYYQPGIGTYTTDGGLVHSSHYARMKSWYQKSKDAAIGTGFENHVMGGYKFLMRYYRPGDDVYFFGFSRGAYTARFLAQMLDYVGLLAPGNEELVRFAWKTFARWQQCTDSTEAEKKKKKDTYNFMAKFRQTFSVPVRRLRFLGLFDTVNSVAAFEGAFLRRKSKFPYTAKSSAKVIRHAVSIDERRAKFRQDLLSQKKPGEHEHHHHLHMHDLNLFDQDDDDDDNKEKQNGESRSPKTTGPKRAPTWQPDRFQPRARSKQHLSPPAQNVDATSSTTSLVSTNMVDKVDEDLDGIDDNAAQDIQEIWFPGCHADIGGGWPLEPSEDVPLSHPPLVWMIREAFRAGLPFDIDALREQNFLIDEELPKLSKTHPLSSHNRQLSEPGFHDAKEAQTPGIDGLSNPAIPVLNIDGHVATESSLNGPPPAPEEAAKKSQPDEAFTHRRKAFLANHAKGSTEGRIHDVLQLNNGTPPGGVFAWNLMEHLPFRRMDLRPDGSWTAIRWPLPRGETRDIPPDAWIHASALRRMEADKKYRPGNLIVGGGGRGMRTAPKSVGMGKWKVLREEGDAVGEVFVRDAPAGNVKKLEK